MPQPARLQREAAATSLAWLRQLTAARRLSLGSAVNDTSPAFATLRPAQRSRQWTRRRQHPLGGWLR